MLLLLDDGKGSIEEETGLGGVSWVMVSPIGDKTFIKEVSRLMFIGLHAGQNLYKCLVQSIFASKIQITPSLSLF